MTETVLITGASSGIGYELAKIFAVNRYNLILVARNMEKMLALKDEMERLNNIDVLVISGDLGRADTPMQVFAEIERLGITIDVLVNNAGFGALGSFPELSLSDQLQMLEVNVNALTHLTHLVLPGMLERGRGKILNVASTAAFLPGPLMAVYYASKAYVLSFSQAINHELAGRGVTVSALCPGPTQTDFAARAKLGASRLFKGPVMSSTKVAQIGFTGMLAGRSVIIPGARNRWLVRTMRFSPTSLVMSIAKQLHSKK